MGDLYARVRPLVGEALDQCQVALIGSELAAAVAEYLVACGVRHWLVMAESEWIEPLIATVCARYGDGIDIRIKRVETLDQMVAADLAIVVNELQAAHCLPRSLPRLAVLTSTSTQPTRAWLAFPGESVQMEGETEGVTSPGWEWQVCAPLMALMARAWLLRGTLYAMATWEEAWACGLRGYAVGLRSDPGRAMWLGPHETSRDETYPYQTPVRQQGTLLICGLGALGSVAALQLAPWADRIVLVDPDCVEEANLVRQVFRCEQIGQAKADALAMSLRAAWPGVDYVPLVTSLRFEEQVAELIAAYGITSALVTTGSQADFAIARALRAAGLPHVVGRCYARARYWEGIVVDGVNGLSHEQMRRQVAAGPTPSPTAEQMAAYGAVGELAAEPATAMETGWAAMWLARLMTQMMTPATLREGWMLARMAAGATCFIGGVAVEKTVDTQDEGTGAVYGVQTPGEVHAWCADATVCALT